MLSRSARGQRDRARPAKSDIIVNVFFVFCLFLWDTIWFVEQSQSWLTLPTTEWIWRVGWFFFFYWCHICSSAHHNPKEVFAVRQPALFPYVALRFRTSGMIWSGRLKKKKRPKRFPCGTCLQRITGGGGSGGGTSLRLMFCFSLSDITCCRLVLSMNLHRSRCTQSVAALFSAS